MSVARRSLHAAAILIALALSFSLSRSTVPVLPEPPVPSGPVDFASLPDAPEKQLVRQYCDTCHGLEWIARSGGSEAGWVDRITRMIRSGAKVPREQVPELAAYLAKVLPRRPAPESIEN
jgi:hypothetical protein